jgi:N-acetylglucosamine transport system substrate-binding protein
MPTPHRRDFLRAAFAAGLLAVPGCATSGGGTSGPRASGTVSNDNPLGVDGSAALEVVMFAGGLKSDLPEVQRTYRQTRPGAAINLTSTANINSLQPRFAGGNPPDLVDDSGAQKIPIAALVGGGQLSDLTPLLDAPSVSDPNRTVRDTIVAEAVPVGSYNGTVYVLNYAHYVYGLWYSKSLFADRGWQVPTEWSAFLELCAELKTAGIAPFAFGGTNATGYVTEMLLTMAAKHGGADLLTRVDNLEPDIWRHDSIRLAADAVQELVGKGYFLPGCAGLTHTQAQTEFVTGKVGCYPAGSWLDNEMKTVIPAGFDMVMAPTPSLSTSDKLPVTALHANPGESFIVPSKAGNARGGMEFLRHMLSTENALAFSKLTGSLTIVTDANERIEDASPALESAKSALATAGRDTFTYLSLLVWYGDLNRGVTAAMAELLAGRTDAAGFTTAAQAAADKVAGDANVPKFKRT